MTTVCINEKTEAGRRILREIAENPKVGQINDFTVPHDENGNPTGYTVEEVFAGVDVKLSEGYGVDFSKIMQMLNSGELNEDELTDELLLSPQFKYEPYPGFKPKLVSRDFIPNIELIKALAAEP